MKPHMRMRIEFGLLTEEYDVCDHTTSCKKCKDCCEESTQVNVGLPSWQKLQTGTVIPAKSTKSN